MVRVLNNREGVVAQKMLGRVWTAMAVATLLNFVQNHHEIIAFLIFKIIFVIDDNDFN